MLTAKPHQTKLVEMIQETNVLALWPCGSGKTFGAMLAAFEVQQWYPGLPVLIVCNKLTRDQWIDTIHTEMPHIDTFKLEKPQSGKITGSPWLITHYEFLKRHGGILSQNVFSCIIADEIHKIKNREAQRTQALKALRSLKKIGLTGSEFSKDVSDLWSLYHWLQPESFGTSRKTNAITFRQFYEMFVDYELNYLGYKTVLGSKNLDHLHEISKAFVHIITRKDIQGVFPQIQHIDVILDLEGQQKTEYKALEKKGEMFIDINDYADPVFIRNQLTRIIRLQQICTDPLLLGSETRSIKLAWVDAWLEENTSEQVIIYTRFRDTALRLATRLDSPVIAGNQVRGLESFLRGSAQVCVATIGKAAESLDLPRVDNAIFLDQSWAKIEMDQAVDRINRMGNDRQKRIYTLIGRNTIDQVIHQCLLEKADQRRLIQLALQDVS